MKKVLFTVLISLFFIGHIYASIYTCEIEGDEVIYSNSDKSSYINVYINDIENIKSFRMYIKYDNKKFQVGTCQFLNYTTSSCFLRTNDKSLIYYDYNYSKDYSLNDYPFFYVNFKSNDKTPTEGETMVNVYFEDVKDNNNKSTTIEGCSKKLVYAIDNTPKTKYEELNILIDGYKFEFDKDTYEYNLYVKKAINTLDVKVHAPDEYKYKINGATDLNTFGNKVTIEVEDKDNNVKVYTINVVRQNKDIERTDIKKDLKSSLIGIKKYVPFTIVVLVILAIALIIINKKDNNKIDKHLDNL